MDIQIDSLSIIPCGSVLLIGMGLGALQRLLH
jgi:hypothetical protein